MLGKTANGVYWMFRYLERSENTARLLDAGHRIALTHSHAANNEWASIISATGSKYVFNEITRESRANEVINFLLRDRSNPSSVLSVINFARDNGRCVRTALTREVWEAINECWLTIKDLLNRQVHEKNLSNVLRIIRNQNGLVRSALHSTMLRNDIYNFSRIGTYIERADSTARLLDVKYYVLLPSVSSVGSSLDNVQWETILRSASALRSYTWLNGGIINPSKIADFLIFDRRLPRSFIFCFAKIVENLENIAMSYGKRFKCNDLADITNERLKISDINSIHQAGLHEFIEQFITEANILARQIEIDFRFYD